VTDAATGGTHVHIQLDAGDLHGWRVVRLVGDLDVFAAPDLTTALTDEVDDWAARRTPGADAPGAAAQDGGLVVDLQQVPFVDSSGLGVLLGAYRRAQAAGFPVRVVSTSEELTTTLMMMGLTSVLPVHPDLDSATAPGAPPDDGAS